MIAHNAVIIVITAIKLSPSKRDSKFNLVVLKMIRPTAIIVKISVNIFIV